MVQDSVPASSRQYSHRLRCVTLASSPPTSQRLISLRTPALGVLFFKHGQFGLTYGKKAHYSGDLSEHAIFWLPTQDSGNQLFSIKGLMICAPLNQCSYKKLCGNCVLSLPHHHESHLLTLKTAIRKLKRWNHSVRALAVARRSRRSAVPSQRSLLIVSRCPRPPCGPYSESLTFSMAPIPLLVEGVMLCCIPACSLRWTGIHCQKDEEIFKHLKQMQRIRSQSRLKDRATSDFLEKERRSLQCR